MAGDDLLTSLVSGDPQSAEKVKAIVAQLRSKGQLADLAQLSGDPALAPFGAHQNQMIQQNEVELGRNAMQNRRDELTQQNITRQLEQGQNTLAETIRYHNMEDQERKDKLAQQKALQGEIENSQSTIDRIGHYDLPLPTMSRSPKNLAIIDAVTQQYPNYDATEYVAKQKARQAFSSGKLGDLSRSADVAIQHLDTADELGAKLHNSPYPALNAITNFYKTQTGSPQVTSFNSAKSIVSDEITKFIVGGGGALADREQLQKQLDAANSPEQLKSVTDTLRKLMAGQINGLQGQFTNSGLGGSEDFQRRFQPRTLEALGLLKVPQSNALPGATAALGGTPGMGSGPPQGPAPMPSQALPQATFSGAPGARPGSISPIEAQLQGQTGFQPAPKSNIVGQQGIVRTGRKMVNGKSIRVGQLADGTIINLE